MSGGAIYLPYLLAHWAHVRAGLAETSARFHDDELGFRPYPNAWTVRELLLHIAQEENGELNYGIRQTSSEFPGAYAPDDFPTLRSIEALLASVHAQAVDYLRGLREEDLARTIHTPWGATYSLVEMIGHLIEHEIHHRGELSLILGMLGREGLNA